MTNLQRQKGFTLVELAIVLTIIGLLIGGILKGQQLIANARVTAQIAQAQAVTAAVTSFSDQYQALPGDMLAATAATRIPNCVGLCAASAGDGNGVIFSAPGNSTWAGGTGGANAGALAVSGEVAGAWAMLANANLVTGVNTNANATATFGSGLPLAKINNFPGLEIATASNDGYIYIAILKTVAAAPADAPGSNAMSAGQAAQIDRKMDDGNPTTGSVIGQGFITNCATAGTGYIEASVTGNDCALNIRVSQ